MVQQLRRRPPRLRHPSAKGARRPGALPRRGAASRGRRCAGQPQSWHGGWRCGRASPLATCRCNRRLAAEGRRRGALLSLGLGLGPPQQQLPQGIHHLAEPVRRRRERTGAFLARQHALLPGQAQPQHALHGVHAHARGSAVRDEGPARNRHDPSWLRVQRCQRHLKEAQRLLRVHTCKPLVRPCGFGFGHAGVGPFLIVALAIFLVDVVPMMISVLAPCGRRGVAPRPRPRRPRGVRARPRARAPRRAFIVAGAASRQPAALRQQRRRLLRQAPIGAGTRRGGGRGGKQEDAQGLVSGWARAAGGPSAEAGAAALGVGPATSSSSASSWRAAAPAEGAVRAAGRRGRGQGAETELADELRAPQRRDALAAPEFGSEEP
mmetsp:Transcript_40039/g.128420  ORF Transcript_40039/g.128420 Transcript_40039/m.128420 type:complete len:379 (+) Transcript_40039:862-1998(+)